MTGAAYKSAPEAARESAAAKYAALGIVAGLAILGLAAFAASRMSFASLSGGVIGSSTDDQVRRGADTLARSFGDIALRLRVCSAALLLAALAAAVYWRKLRAWIGTAVFPLPRFLREAAGSVIRAAKADGRFHACVLLALCVWGIALRLRLLFHPMGYDEADSFITFASRPLYIGLSWYPEPNNHLLNTLLMHVSWRLFGDHEWALRLSALIAGCLLVPVTYWAARTLYGKHAALIAAALVAGASHLIAYSVDGRGYSALSVLFLLLLIVSQYLVEHDSPPAWFLWAIIAALGFYTIPVMLYAAGTIAMWILLTSPAAGPKRPFGQWFTRVVSAVALTGALTALLYLPVLIASGWKPLFSNQHVRSRSLAYLMANFPGNVNQAWRMWTADVPEPLIWILTAAFALALVAHRLTSRYRTPLPLAAALVIAPLLVLQRVVPYARIWIIFLPLCAAVCGAGLWLVARRLGARDGAGFSRAAAAIALGCLALLCIPDLRGTRLTSKLGLEGIDQIVAWLRSDLAPGDAVIAPGGIRAPLSYYIRRRGLPLVNRPASCAPATLVLYTRSGTHAANPPAAGTRVLLVMSGARESLDTFVPCTAGRIQSAPKLVYENDGVRAYESYFVSGLASPAAGSRASASRAVAGLE